jgi:hypothetical protein
VEGWWKVGGRLGLLAQGLAVCAIIMMMCQSSHCEAPYSTAVQAGVAFMVVA